jgi:hypothetical protein
MSSFSAGQHWEHDFEEEGDLQDYSTYTLPVLSEGSTPVEQSEEAMEVLV